MSVHCRCAVTGPQRYPGRMGCFCRIQSVNACACVKLHSAMGSQHSTFLGDHKQPFARHSLIQLRMRLRRTVHLRLSEKTTEWIWISIQRHLPTHMCVTSAPSGCDACVTRVLPRAYKQSSLFGISSVWAMDETGGSGGCPRPTNSF